MPDGSIIIAVPPCDITTTSYTLTSGATITNPGGLTSVEPADFAELSTLDPHKCYVAASAKSTNPVFGTAHGATVRLPAFAYGVAPNMRRLSQYRTIVTNAGETLPWTEYVLPNAVTLGGTWSDGAIASVSTLDDDPWAGTGSYYSGEVGGGDFLADFATPTASPATGADKQCFVVQAGAGGGTSSSTIEIHLAEGGVSLALLRSVTIPAGYGAITVVAPWNASLLGTASGAAAQIIVRVVAGPAMRLARLRWVADVRSAPLYDSGWYDLTYQDSVVGAASAPVPIASHLSRVVDVAATTWLTGARRIVHFWRCDSLGDGTSATDTWRVGRIWGSGHIQPANGPGPGSSVTVEDASTSGETIGGQTTGNVGARRRVANLSMPMLTGPEAATLAWRLDYGSGKLNPFMVSILPDDDDFRAWGCLYCTMEPDGITFPSAMIRTRTMNLREKL